MEILFSTLLLVVGFIFLIKGADWLVEGASALANRLGVSPFMIGLTVVAFGTSAPELVVNLISSWQGQTDLAIGNILGSNMANTLLILGAAALLSPLVISRQTVKREIPFSILATLVVLIVANDVLIDQFSFNIISRIDGLVMLILFIAFMYVSFSGTRGAIEEDIKPNGKSITEAHIYSLVGLAGLILGGKLVVDSAVDIARFFNFSEAFIGLTIVAVGTSLPELAATAVAAYRKQNDIAIGNVIGSNIFNLLWVLGLSAVIRPLPFSDTNNAVLITLIAVTLLLIFALKWNARHRIERTHGLIFILLYIVFIYVTSLSQ